ncbi:MAG: DUF1580 domain-containing protein [Pirellulaceae bacterium]|nr:DUF1580 domain-containing protein [Pirellulaceae bacterium]
MIDTQTETIITLTEAARLLPRRRAGRPVHVSCLYRWAQIGCRGVRLEIVQIGGTKCTSREAMQRFFGRLTAQANGQPVAPPPRSKSRQRQIDAAEKRLAAAGI